MFGQQNPSGLFGSTFGTKTTATTTSTTSTTGFPSFTFCGAAPASTTATGVGASPLSLFSRVGSGQQPQIAGNLFGGTAATTTATQPSFAQAAAAPTTQTTASTASTLGAIFGAPQMASIPSLTAGGNKPPASSLFAFGAANSGAALPTTTAPTAPSSGFLFGSTTSSAAASSAAAPLQTTALTTLTAANASTTTSTTPSTGFSSFSLAGTAPASTTATGVGASPLSLFSRVGSGQQPQIGGNLFGGTAATTTATQPSFAQAAAAPTTQTMPTTTTSTASTLGAIFGAPQMASIPTLTAGGNKPAAPSLFAFGAANSGAALPTTTAPTAPSSGFLFGSTTSTAAASSAAAPLQTTASTTSTAANTPVSSSAPTISSLFGTGAPSALATATTTTGAGLTLPLFGGTLAGATALPGIGTTTTGAVTSSLGSSLATFSTAPSASVAPQATTKMNFKNLEQVLLRMMVDFQGQERDFLNEIDDLNAYDAVLRRAQDKIALLDGDMDELEHEKNHFVYELDVLSQQQTELETVIREMEKSLQLPDISEGQPLGLGPQAAIAGSVDIQRQNMLQLGMVVNSQLKQLDEDVAELCDQILDLHRISGRTHALTAIDGAGENSWGEDENEPAVEKIRRILHSQLDTLVWVDKQSEVLNNKLKKAQTSLLTLRSNT